MRRFGLDFLEPWQKRIHRRKRWRHEDPDVFALGPQSFRESQAAAERVAVGVLVAEDQDLLVRVDQVLDLVIQMRLVEFGGRYGFGPSSTPLL